MYQTEQRIVGLKNYWKITVLILLAGVLSGFLIWNFWPQLSAIGWINTSAKTTTPAYATEQNQIISIVKKYAPAVVSIVASADEPKYEECFNEESVDVPSWCENGTEKKRVGTGTGFIVSPDGYIVTNKHVVENEKGEYTVFLNDESNSGTKYKAQVLARDPNNDIAILKIEATKLPTVSLGNSEKIAVG